MNTKNDIERLIDETMNSLDNLQQVAVNPYLFTKIQARIQYKKQQQNLTWLKLLPGLPVVLILLMTVNFISYYNLKSIGATKSSIQKITATQAFANEYNLNQGQYNY